MRSTRTVARRGNAEDNYHNTQGDPLTRAYYLANGTYYVDSVNGDDGNAGTSANAPYQNLSALPSLVSGNNLSLACGSSWLGQKIKCPAGNIKIGSYVPPQTGNTTTPIIDTSNTETGWTLLGGTTNVYTKTVAFLADDMYDSSTWINVLENGEFLTNVANSATCDATAGSYYVSSHNGTSITIGIHSTDSADPDTHTIRVTKKSHGIDARGQDNITVFDVQSQYCLHKGGCLKVGENCTIHSCNLLYGNVHNAYAEQFSAFVNCTLYGWYTTETMSYIVFNQDTPSGGNIAIRDCTIGNPDTFETSSVGCYSHHNTSGNYGTFEIADSTFRNLSIAADSNHVPNVNVSGCTFTDCNTIHRITGDGSTWTFSDCTATNATANAARWLDGTLVNSDATLNMTNCDFDAVNINNAAIYINKSNYSLNLDTCTFTTGDNAGGRNGIWLDDVVTPGSVSMQNTQWIASGAGGWNKQLAFELLVASTFYVGDNNTFDGQFGYFVEQNNTGYANSLANKFANWRADTGQDANSTFILP